MPWSWAAPRLIRSMRRTSSPSRTTAAPTTRRTPPASSSSMRCASGRSRCGGARRGRVDIGIVYVTNEISGQRQYLDGFGRNPFAEWRASLDEIARTKVSIALLRLKAGNISQVKSVGGGVRELKGDFRPGYRVYFGRDGATVVILLGGGTKKTQQSDIQKAHDRWIDYKRRKSV